MSLYHCFYCGGHESTFPEFILLENKFPEGQETIEKSYNNEFQNMWNKIREKHLIEKTDCEETYKEFYKQMYSKCDSWFCSKECLIEYLSLPRDNVGNPLKINDKVWVSDSEDWDYCGIIQQFKFDKKEPRVLVLVGDYTTEYLTSEVKLV